MLEIASWNPKLLRTFAAGRTRPRSLSSCFSSPLYAMGKGYAHLYLQGLGHRPGVIYGAISISIVQVGDQCSSDADSQNGCLVSHVLEHLMGQDVFD